MHRSEKKKALLVSQQGFSFRSLAVTYSGMPEGHTTIGAERFHFRVRNGIGWFPLAIAARQTVLRSMYRSVLRDRLTVLESIKFFVPTLSRSKWNEFHSIHLHRSITIIRCGRLFGSQPNPLRLYGQVSRAISTG